MLYPEVKIFGNQSIEQIKNFGLRVWDRKKSIELIEHTELIFVSRQSEEYFYDCRHIVVLNKKDADEKIKVKLIHINGSEEITFIREKEFSLKVLEFMKRYKYLNGEVYHYSKNGNVISQFGVEKILIPK